MSKCTLKIFSCLEIVMLKYYHGTVFVGLFDLVHLTLFENINTVFQRVVGTTNKNNSSFNKHRRFRTLTF